jgi:hypothetical protein
MWLLAILNPDTAAAIRVRSAPLVLSKACSPAPVASGKATWPPSRLSSRLHNQARPEFVDLQCEAIRLLVRVVEPPDHRVQDLQSRSHAPACRLAGRGVPAGVDG